MTISMIAAVSENGVIGRNNDLPWRLPDDMKYFMQTTKGHAVIMGRRNYESLPDKFRPLANRQNIVVTRQKNFHAPHCVIANSLNDALTKADATLSDEIFLIGGSQIYAEGLAKANKLYLTEIKAQIEGDVYFPRFNAADWKEDSRIHHAMDERHQYPFDFVIYSRI